MHRGYRVGILKTLRETLLVLNSFLTTTWTVTVTFSELIEHTELSIVQLLTICNTTLHPKVIKRAQSTPLNKHYIASMVR